MNVQANPIPPVQPEPAEPDELQEPLADDSLKERIQSACRAANEPLRALAEAVIEAAEEVERADIIAWCVEAGWSESHARSTVCQILRKGGKPARKSGAGRETPAEAIKLADHALKECGGDKDKARKWLRAASRYLAKCQVIVDQYNLNPGIQ